MGTLSLITAVAALQFAVVESEPATKPETKQETKQELHEHPTLVSMLRENNRLRARVSLRPQTMSPELTKAAQDHANYMARTGNFSHYSNGGPSGRAARYGYRGGIAENIAMGQSNVALAFRGWRNSSGHWANITSGATQAGFGFAISRNGTCYWVGVYGH